MPDFDEHLRDLVEWALDRYIAEADRAERRDAPTPAPGLARAKRRPTRPNVTSPYMLAEWCDDGRGWVTRHPDVQFRCFARDAAEEHADCPPACDPSRMSEDTVRSILRRAGLASSGAHVALFRSLVARERAAIAADKGGR